MPQHRTIPRVCDQCQAAYLAFSHNPDSRFCSRACFRIGCRRPPPIALIDNGTAARIPLRGRNGSTRAHTVVDAVDISAVSQWSWSLGTTGYAIRSLRSGGHVRLHREILGLSVGDGIEVDHINRDRLDNRRANLRIGGHPENAQNVPSRAGSSVYRGVAWDTSRKKWQAYVRVNGKSIGLGRFQHEEEAAAAALAGRRQYLPYATD